MQLPRSRRSLAVTAGALQRPQERPGEEVCRTVAASSMLRVISKKDKFDSIQMIQCLLDFCFRSVVFNTIQSLSFIDDPDPHAINLCLGTTPAFKGKRQGILINDQMCSKIKIGRNPQYSSYMDEKIFLFLRFIKPHS